MSPRYRSRVSSGKGNAGTRDYSETTAEQIGQEVRKLVDEAYQLARRTLMADGDKLELIAKDLLECETLDDSEIKEIAEHGRLINSPPSGARPTGKKMLAENPLGLLGLTARETEVLTLDRTR
jgi:hypothetical protein